MSFSSAADLASDPQITGRHRSTRLPYQCIVDRSQKQFSMRTKYHPDFPGFYGTFVSLRLLPKDEGRIPITKSGSETFTKR